MLATSFPSSGLGTPLLEAPLRRANHKVHFHDFPVPHASSLMLNRVHLSGSEAELRGYAVPSGSLGLRGRCFLCHAANMVLNLGSRLRSLSLLGVSEIMRSTTRSVVTPSLSAAKFTTMR